MIIRLGLSAAIALGLFWTASPAHAETRCPIGFYRAPTGECVMRAECGLATPPPIGATALCNDGCYSFDDANDPDGPCNRHGGTQQSPVGQ